MKYYIKTFGCAANVADSERLHTYYREKGFSPAQSEKDADSVIINTCMIRQSAEHRVYGLIHNLTKKRLNGRKRRIIVTGCMVGMAIRDRSGKAMANLKKKLPDVDEFLTIDEIGFNYLPTRKDNDMAYIPISYGCNNYCTYCVVPYTRGKEVSRPYDVIMEEVESLAKRGYTHITLLGQNVNSYGSDLIAHKRKRLPTWNGKPVLPVFVKHLGKMRIPTLFPHLLRRICAVPVIQHVDFLSSNPWDFSDELIDVISENPKISRHIHLPVQSGDTRILRKMNRWYTRGEYLALINKIRKRIPDVTFSTDIIVGFCGETKRQFENTLSLAKEVGFTKAYIAMYSDRPLTVAHASLGDTVPYREKKKRWKILEEAINTESIKKGTYNKGNA